MQYFHALYQQSKNWISFRINHQTAGNIGFERLKLHAEHMHCLAAPQSKRFCQTQSASVTPKDPSIHHVNVLVPSPKQRILRCEHPLNAEIGQVRSVSRLSRSIVGAKSDSDSNRLTNGPRPPLWGACVCLLCKFDASYSVGRKYRVYAAV